ncbi:MAG TPA: BREX-2 system adenine-specific DNA-methyltransferase PglX, partial [Candidatus Anammoximicrobium sp.]|nr:BREX-2 system adenine-specific DNA-methyltransferase PglX [Candidatus Anammoximicrobium sp.]
MINRPALLSDLQKLLRQLETDLRQRCDEAPEIDAALRAEYDSARAAERTADSFEAWRADYITQIAVAWILTCVFARFLEDNRLVDPPKLSGPGERLRRARDEHELYFREHPTHTDREYLLAVFSELGKLPGCAELFDVGRLSLVTGHSSLVTGHSSLVTANQGPMTNDQRPRTKDLIHWLSGDAARMMLTFVQRIEPESGNLIHDFTQRSPHAPREDGRLAERDDYFDTRFLGDLYQDLSEAARKKYALLQTPEFVEEFILDRTLEPALDEFGLVTGHWSLVTGHSSLVTGHSSLVTGRKTNDQGQMTNDLFKMIDPACGSGHFLLGAFRRILDRWRKAEPGTNERELVQRALDSVHGVDINPYAVAIARFRLLLAAMKACGIERLADAPAFRINLACGDSLLHGSAGGDQMVLGFHELAHAYRSEDLAELRRILRPGSYHAVVANPPYITPKDKALNQAYRERYSACHMRYSLAVPFMQRIFDLASEDAYTGQITANSFMKREFGKKLIEAFFPSTDLTHVIDTAGAYLPGFGTPTVVLFGRHRKPVADTIRAVLGIRGEPSTPNDEAKGLVWSAIIAQIDDPGSQSEFVSVGDSPRDAFHKHPWSIGGGGAAELKGQLEEGATETLSTGCVSIGFASFTGQDEAFVADRSTLLRARLPNEYIRQFVVGDAVRDWAVEARECAFAPYDEAFSC